MIERVQVILDDVATDVTVGYVGPMASEYVDDGIPFLRSLNVQRLRISTEDVKFISPAFHGKLRKSALKPGDVVIVRTGQPGTCAVIPDTLPVANCSDVVVVRCGPRIRPRFLAYWVNAVLVDHVASHVVGAVQQHFNVASARKMPILLPDVAEQDRMLSILAALDDRIELNRRMSATLEEMARALFRSWFVDFDPVHAKARGEAPAHMDAATAALFPDRFGEDGLPEGWRLSGLDEVADFLNGLALQKFPAVEGRPSLPVIKIAELRSGVSAKSGRAAREIQDRYVVRDGDILFSWSGSLLQRIWTGGEGALNQHLFKVTSTTVPKWFHFFSVDQHLEEFRAVAASKATTMGHIQRHHLRDAKVVVPDSTLMSSLDAFVAPLFSCWIQVEIESHRLTVLRDELLPKLMSGELRVRDAEQQIAVAV